MTIFQVVLSYLDRDAWNDSKTPLPDGAEVTVDGEQSPEETNKTDVAAASFWAKVESSDGDNVTVKSFDGTVSVRQRKTLRHRVDVTKAITGCTRDKKHDSFAATWFIDRALELSKDDIDAQHITSVRVHSDNAASHFHSVATMAWATMHLKTAPLVPLEPNELDAPAPAKTEWTADEAGAVTHTLQASGTTSRRQLTLLVNGDPFGGVKKVGINLNTGSVDVVTGNDEKFQSTLRVDGDYRRTSTATLHAMQRLCRDCKVQLELTMGRPASASNTILSWTWVFGCPGYVRALDTRAIRA